MSQNELMLTVGVGLLAMGVAVHILSCWLRAVYPEPPDPQPEDVETFALVKGRERYILLVARSQAREAINTVFRWAADPELSLDLDNALFVTAQIEERCLGRGELVRKGKQKARGTRSPNEW